MCELVFVNLNSVTLNRLATLNLGLMDSSVANKDGWGIFTQKNGLFKTSETPWKTIGFGTKLREMIQDDKPVLFHVRQATKGSMIKDEFSHPFETQNLVLAHNGTLEPLVPLDEYKDRLDSEIFLSELDKKYIELNGDIVQSLQGSMAKFYGTFAFLIYDKNKKKFFAVRGKTKLLHVSQVLGEEGIGDPKPIGYVINSLFNDLIEGADSALEASMLLGGKFLFMEEPKLIVKETIIELKNLEITKIGEVKENEKPAPVHVVEPRPRPSYAGIVPAGNVKNVYTGPTGSLFQDLIPVASNLIEWLKKYNLDLDDLEEILYMTLGQGILTCTDVDIKSLFEQIIPRIQGKKVLREWWKKNMFLTHDTIIEVSEDHELQFPYILEPNYKKVMEVFGEYIKELERK